MANFRHCLETTDVVFGVFAKTNDPFFIEILGRTGFDFVILDNEHGPNSVRDLYPLITAAETADIYPIVRVGKLQDLEIQRALDLRPAGVQIPQIQSRADAENVRAYTRFHPRGRRGVCRFVRAADFSLMDKSEFFSSQNQTVTIIHIEGTEGIDAFDYIVTVEDIDIIFIGPYDLSQSLGVPGDVENPRVLTEIEKLVTRCQAHHKHIGIFADTPPAAQRYQQMGVKYIAYSVDVGIFAQACTDLIQQLKAL